MKSIKYFAMFLLTGLFSLSMASCLYDDDDDSQKKISPAYYTQISGSHMGSVQYYVDDLTTPKKVEGIATVITADSTIKVTGLPAEAFVKNISNDDIRNALLAQPTPELTSRFLIYNAYDEGLDFMTYPLTVEFKNVMVGESSHDYQIRLLYPSLTSGYANAKCSVVGFYMYPAALYEGDTMIEQFVTNTGEVGKEDIMYIEGIR